MDEGKSRLSPGDATAASPGGVAPVSERDRELAELEETIRRRLRSNQRFLERFLDEDFVDDEGGDDGEAGDDGGTG